MDFTTGDTSEMSKQATSSNSRSCDHARKACVCVGHNAKNVKSNLNHNATKRRLAVREARRGEV